MKVAIVGAGKLGLTVTEALLSGDNEVTLIDLDSDLLQRISAQMDLLTVAGNGKNTSLLKELKIQSYNFLLAVTDNDELNMVICTLARKLGCPHVIARVRDPEHVGQLDFIKKTFGIDFIVNPDLTIAREIYKYLVEKYALSGGIFHSGKVSIVEFPAERLPVLFNQKIDEVSKMLEGMLVVAVSRNGKIIIPVGSTVIQEEDILYVLGEQEAADRLNELVQDKQTYTDLQRVMIAGGGKSGFYLAKLLSDFDISVKIIEIDKARCQYLSEHLDDVMVLHGDATDQSLLEEENIDEMDAFVSLTGFDEENLLLALLATQKNIEDVVAKVSRKSYAELIEKLGVDMALNPLEMTAAEILRFIQGSKHIIFSKVIQGQAEFIEIIARRPMPLFDAPISALKLPEDVLIAAIHRQGEPIIPQGDTVIQEGDQVIILSLLSQLPALEKLLQRKKWKVV